MRETFRLLRLAQVLLCIRHNEAAIWRGRDNLAKAIVVRDAILAELAIAAHTEQDLPASLLKADVRPIVTRRQQA